MTTREEIADFIEYTGTDWESRMRSGAMTRPLANEQADAILTSEWFREALAEAWHEGFIRCADWWEIHHAREVADGFNPHKGGADRG